MFLKQLRETTGRKDVDAAEFWRHFFDAFYE